MKLTPSIARSACADTDSKPPSDPDLPSPTLLTIIIIVIIILFLSPTQV